MPPCDEAKRRQKAEKSDLGFWAPIHPASPGPSRRMRLTSEWDDRLNADSGGYGSPLKDDVQDEKHHGSQEHNLNEKWLVHKGKICARINIHQGHKTARQNSSLSFR